MDSTSKIIALIKAVGGSGGGGGGSGGGYLAVHSNDGVLDKTWKEINDALVEGKYVCLVQISDETKHKINFITWYDGSEYYVEINGNSYVTDSENGYPILESS